MLLGEHAVLHGYPALVMAVNRRLRVTLVPRPDCKVRIESALGEHETGLEAIEPHPAFRFILAAVSRSANLLPSGFDLRVESEFSHEMGFGSSAAVTVATVSVLRRFAGRDADLESVRDEAIEIVRSVQGRASGADVAASAYGGILLYRAEPREVQRFSATLVMLAVYCGYKTPTADVIRHVENAWQMRIDDLRALYARIGACAAEGAAALERGDLKSFGDALNAGQALMEELGVNTPELAAIVAELRQIPGIYGAKISGSGLGDCAIGLGNAARAPNGFASMFIETARNGLTTNP
jgi:mevalonate kinase